MKIKKTSFVGSCFLAFLIILACDNHAENKTTELYTIRYSEENLRINLYVRNNIDTLYIEKIDNNFHKIERIKLKPALLENLKNNIIKSLDIEVLKTKRNSDNKYDNLLIEISTTNKSFKANYKDVGRDFNISNDFKGMIDELKESDERIETILN